MARQLLLIALVAALFGCSSPELLVGYARPGFVVRVRESDGRLHWRDNSGGDTDEVLGIRRGPSRQLYLCSYRAHKIIAYRETRQTETGVFAGPDTIQGPTDLLFLPDGNMLVACSGSTQYLLDEQFDASGVELVILSGPKSDSPGKRIAIVDKGSYSGVPTSLALGEDGAVYVGGRDSSTVLRMDPSLQRATVFADIGAALNRGPTHITFGPDGALYATSLFDTKVVRIDANGTTEFINDAELTKPAGLAFSHNGEQLFVASVNRGEIRRYDANTGAFIDTLATEMAEPWAVIRR